jgi:nucleoside-diphosphate-sugar epimerase
MSGQAILVTGAAGLIGFHVARQLLSEGRDVVGFDNLNACCDPALKLARLDVLRGQARFEFVHADLADRSSISSLFAANRFARVTGVISRVVDQLPEADPPSGSAPARIYNAGNNRPEELTHVVAVLEQALGRTATREMLPMQPGDVPDTFADVGDLMRDTGFRPQTPIDDGIRQFVARSCDHYKV